MGLAVGGSGGEVNSCRVAGCGVHRLYGGLVALCVDEELDLALDE